MLRVNARQVMVSDLDTLYHEFDIPRNPIEVVFDDGMIQTTSRELIYSYLFWDYQRRYTKAPLLMRHHLSNAQRMNKSTSLLLIKHCFWDTYDAYQGEIDINNLSYIAYQITNRLYNEIVIRMRPYTPLISAFDIIEVLNHPEIKEAKANCKPTHRGIDATHRVIEDVLLREGELVGNRFGETAKSGLVSMVQAKQVIGPRGMVTEIDNWIFPTPIMPGYAEGTTLLHDHAIDSRTASIALFFAKDPLSHVEYLNRQFQLLLQTIRHVFKGDCGSEYTLPLFVKDKQDLNTFEGKYYYHGDHLHRITQEDTHLIGTTVNVRSPLGCLAIAKQGICECCIGELALQVQEGANLGHLIVIYLCALISQNVLSTKHVIGSAETATFHIMDGDRPYLKHGDRENSLALNPKLRGRKVILSVKQNALFNIAEIKRIDQLDKYPITRITDIEYVTIKIVDEVRDETHVIDVVVSQGNKHSSFTPEFLAYIKRKGFDVSDDNQNYDIDITDWDYEKAVFILPMKNANMMEFMEAISNVVKLKQLRGSKAKKVRELSKSMDGLSGIVMELHSVINEKIYYNIAHCEIILAVCLIGDPVSKDYRPRPPSQERTLAPFKDLMTLRSMSCAYAFEHHGTRMVDRNAFTVRKRPSHPMDEIFSPDEFDLDE